MKVVLETKYGSFAGTICTSGFFTIVLRIQPEDLPAHQFLSRMDGDSWLVEIPLEHETKTAPSHYLR